MSEVRLWRGLLKVRVLERGNGSWLVEALHDFRNIKKGERFLTRWTNLQRIVKEATK